MMRSHAIALFSLFIFSPILAEEERDLPGKKSFMTRAKHVVRTVKQNESVQLAVAATVLIGIPTAYVRLIWGTLSPFKKKKSSLLNKFKNRGPDHYYISCDEMMKIVREHKNEGREVARGWLLAALLTRINGLKSLGNQNEVNACIEGIKKLLTCNLPIQFELATRSNIELDLRLLDLRNPTSAERDIIEKIQIFLLRYPNNALQNR